MNFIEREVVVRTKVLEAEFKINRETVEGLIRGYIARTRPEILKSDDVKISFLNPDHSPAYPVHVTVRRPYE
jgi:hypothetical protein